MSVPISSHAFWSESELGAAMAAVARQLRGNLPLDPTFAPSASGATVENINAACAQVGLECEEVALHRHDFKRTLSSSLPALVWVEGRGGILVTRTRGRHAHLLTRDSTICKVPVKEVRQILCDRGAEPDRAEVERVLNLCGIAPRRMAAAVDVLVDARLQHHPLGRLFTLRLPPGSDFFRQLKKAGLLRWFLAMMSAHAAEYVCLVAAWSVMGRAAIEERVDSMTSTTWLLLLAAMVPCRMLTTWAQGVVAVRAGGLLRKRLLSGILKLQPAEVRHEGAGAFLARAIDAETVESLALSGGLASLLALLELTAAAVVLGAGNAVLELPLLAVWCGGTAFLAWKYAQRRQAWTDSRLTMTHEHVELMVGHRTRLAQQPANRRHLEEDQRLASYLAASKAMDAHGARLEGLIPRSWFLAGVLGLAPTFLSAERDPIALGASIGGVLLAWQALRRLTTGLSNLSGALVSWKRIAALFHAAARSENLAASPPPSESPAVIEARGLTYQHSGHSEPVLRGLDLTIQPGEKLLVQGRSGGGKSTLVGLLAGLRNPTDGLLLSGGRDRASLGAARWLRCVTAAPQFHENHVLSGTFAYNLLLGRRWPATEEDLNEANEVTRDAGLGPLLDRMPSGLMQLVGETGWQLSSGERSRLFLCRALLSRAELVILDESFAALDPESLQQALECSLRRTKSLLVIAHP